MGQHHMDVCGESRAVTRAHLLRLAGEGGVPPDLARATIDQIRPAAWLWRASEQDADGKLPVVPHCPHIADLLRTPCNTATSSICASIITPRGYC
jgi:hypothetical protein